MLPDIRTSADLSAYLAGNPDASDIMVVVDRLLASPDWMMLESRTDIPLPQFTIGYLPTRDSHTFLAVLVAPPAGGPTARRSAQPRRPGPPRRAS